MGSLKGQTVLVTGASSGFGEAIAFAFGLQGANVALVARREDALKAVAVEVEARGGQALVCPTDVTDENQIHAAIEQTRTVFGDIHVLVNNAGTNVTARSIADTTLEQWRLMMEVNLASAFVFTKAILPEMKSRGGGLIVNVSSLSGLVPNGRGGVGYSASKMGMDALNRVTNEEGNAYGVRACLLCPGSGNTPLISRRPTPPSDKQRETMLQSEDIAQVVVFLASLPPHVNIDLLSIRPTKS